MTSGELVQKALGGPSTRGLLRVWSLVPEHGVRGSKGLAEASGLQVRTVQRYLSMLQLLGLVTRAGGKTATWTVVDELSDATRATLVAVCERRIRLDIKHQTTVVENEIAPPVEVNSSTSGGIIAPPATTIAPPVEVNSSTSGGIWEGSGVARVKERSCSTVKTGTLVVAVNNNNKSNSNMSNPPSATSTALLVAENQSLLDQLVDARVEIAQLQAQVVKLKKAKRDETHGTPAQEQLLAEVFLDWQTVLGYPDRTLKDERRTKLMARVKDGFTRDQFRRVWALAKLDTFLQGQNDRDTKYDDITTLCKNRSAFERYLAKPAGVNWRNQYTNDPTLMPKPQSEVKVTMI